MKSLVISLCLLLSYNTTLFSQNRDSVMVVRAKWTSQKIAPKTKLKTYHFTEKSLFAANEYISIVEIKTPGKKVALSVGADEKTLIKTSAFGKEANALVALNGTFFDIKNGGSVDFVKANGAVVNTTRLDKNGLRSRHQRTALVMDNGKLKIQKWDNTADWETRLEASDVMVSGPLLTFNMVDEALDTTSFTKARHPRTSVGITSKGTVLLVTVDGRQEQSAGMSLHELTKLMRWLGCITSVNLDGGGSTTLWVQNAPGNGVVNYPSDNKKWDHEGERKVANVILLKRK